MRNGYGRTEGERRPNNIGKLILTKVEHNGLIGAPGYHQALVIQRQSANELVSRHSSSFA
jgi:hypothetical protein